MDLGFADCLLDLELRQLIRGGAAVTLEPRLFTLLETLITRRPERVSCIELHEVLWPGAMAPSSSLARLVAQLREALGDTGAESPLIVAEGDAGYAFVATVDILSPDLSADPASPAPQGGSARWTLLAGERVVPLPEGEHLAGRSAECNIVIDSKSVSRRHAQFLVSRGSLMLVDLGSTNGTFVNGAPVNGRTRLQHGDEIMLGKIRLTLRAVSRLH